MDPALIGAIVKALGDLATLIPTRDRAAREQFEILERHVRLLKEQAESLDREIDSLRAQNHELERENRDLKERVGHHFVSTDYQVIDGMAWKQDANGEWKDGPYCPTCQTRMSDVAGIVFKCRKCGYSTTRMPGSGPK